MPEETQRNHRTRRADSRAARQVRGPGTCCRGCHDRWRRHRGRSHDDCSRGGYLLRELKKEYGARLLLGSGTVTTAAQAEATIRGRCGIRRQPQPAHRSRHRRQPRATGKVSIPGALTPTEAITAWDAGADYVKIFPCSAVGGAGYLKALLAPFPHLKLIPTGGVTLQTAESFLTAGARALGIGSDLVNLAAIDAGPPGNNHPNRPRLFESDRRFSSSKTRGKVGNDRKLSVWMLRSGLELIGLAHEPNGQLLRQLHSLILIKPMLCDKLRKERCVDAARDIMSRRDGKKRACVVVKPDCVVEPSGFCYLFAKTAHPLRAVVKPPGRSQPQTGIVSRQRRKFPAIGCFVERKENDGQSCLVSKSS